jgi:hypothetical protein
MLPEIFVFVQNAPDQNKKTVCGGIKLYVLYF